MRMTYRRRPHPGWAPTRPKLCPRSRCTCASRGEGSRHARSTTRCRTDPHGDAAEVVLHVADRAEALGYEAFFLAEGWGHDAGVLLAEVATRTNRITIGTGIINVWGRTPASIAMLATSLAEVSGDRFMLGLGAGSPPLAEGLHDVAFTAPVERLGAVTRQVRRLLSGQRLEPTVERDNRPLKLAAPPRTRDPHQPGRPRPQRRTAGRRARRRVVPLPAAAVRPGRGHSAAGEGRGARCRRPHASDDRSLHPHSCLRRSREGTRGGLLVGVVLPRQHGSAVPQDPAPTRTRPGSRRSPRRQPDPAHLRGPRVGPGLLDELTLWGDAEHAREALDSWYAAGAQMPTLTLPPGRPVEELDYMLETLRP